MGQNQKDPKRRRGRPQMRPDAETHRLIIEAAADEFHANGYAATGMGAVAQRAGVSTKTLYRLIPTKAELFTSVVKDRICRFILAFDHETEGVQDVATALEHVLIAYAALTLGEETIAMNKLVIAECDRFPEIAAAFYDAAIVRTSKAMETWLRQQCDRGLIQLENPAAATGMLRGMMVLEPQRAAMLGQKPAPGAEEIAERARTCTRLFLDGCRVRGAARMA